MVLPDLPKEIYKKMEELRKNLDLGQWQFYILGIWAVNEMLGGDDGQAEPRSIEAAVGWLKEKFPKPAEQTFKPRWKGKKA